MRKLLITIALSLACVLSAAPAQAMDFGMQQEPMTAARCDQIAALNSRWVRIMVMPTRWADTDYLGVVKRCKADGLKVMVSLMFWQSHPSPAYIAAFAAVAARKLGPYVDAWSPMNEPNHRYFQPAYNPYCSGPVTKTTAARKVRFKRVRRGSWKRVRRHGEVRYRHVKHRRGRYRRVVRTRWATATRVEPLGSTVCLAITSRQAYDAAAAQVHHWDPSASLIIGDTAGQPITYLRAWFAASSKRPLGNILGVHYSVPTVSVRALAKANGLALWVPEAGMLPKEQALFAPWLKSLQQAGVKVVIYYNGLAADAWRDQTLTPSARVIAAHWN